MQHFKYKLIAAVSAAAIALPLHAEKNDASSKDKPPREQAKNQVTGKSGTYFRQCQCPRQENTGTKPGFHRQRGITQSARHSRPR